MAHVPLFSRPRKGLSSGAMDATETALVRDSFARLADMGDALVADFYRRLFTAVPQVRALFPADMRSQRQKLLGTLAAVVEALDRPERLTGIAGTLGRNHAVYGTREEHYAPVGEALIAALAHHLRERWTAETEAAWRKAYGALARLMIEGQRSVA